MAMRTHRETRSAKATYGIVNDEATGVYSGAASSVGFIAAGTVVANFTATGGTVTGTLSITGAMDVTGVLALTGGATIPAGKSLALTGATIALDANSSLKSQNFAQNIPATGTVITNAAALTGQWNYVTASDNTKGVQLPTGVAGTPIYVYSSVAAKTVKVYPPTNGTIDGGSANAAVAVGAFYPAMFIATNATNYQGYYAANVVF